MSDQQLIEAAVEGDTALVQRLLHAPLDINAKDEDGWTALHSACWKGHLETAVFLASLPTADLNGGNRLGETPLMVAVDGNRVGVIRYLLGRSELDVNARDNDAWTALHWACKGGHLEIVELLLKHPETDLRIPNSEGQTALELAGNHAGIRTLFAQWTDDVASAENLEPATGEFLRAALEGDCQRVQHLLRAAVDVRACLPNRRMALHLASKNGHEAVVQCLCDDPRIWPNARDRMGWTALHWACYKDHLATFLILSGHRDTDSQAIDEQGRVPLDCCPRRDSRVRQYLRERNTAVDPHMEQLLSAARAGRIGEIDHMIRNRIVGGVNSFGVDGMTALHVASRYGHKSLIQYLGEHETLQWGARDEQGRTALHEACRWDETLELVQLFLSRMSVEEIAIPDNRGQTAFHAALARNQTDVVSCFLDHEKIDPHMSLLFIVQNFGVKFLEVFAAAFTEDRNVLRKSISQAYAAVKRLPAQNVVDQNTTIDVSPVGGNEEIQADHLVVDAESQNMDITQEVAAMVEVDASHTDAAETIVARKDVDDISEDSDGEIDESVIFNALEQERRSLSDPENVETNAEISMYTSESGNGPTESEIAKHELETHVSPSRETVNKTASREVEARNLTPLNFSVTNSFARLLEPKHPETNVTTMRNTTKDVALKCIKPHSQDVLMPEQSTAQDELKSTQKTIEKFLDIMSDTEPGECTIGRESSKTISSVQQHAEASGVLSKELRKGQGGGDDNASESGECLDEVQQKTLTGASKVQNDTKSPGLYSTEVELGGKTSNFQPEESGEEPPSKTIPILASKDSTDMNMEIGVGSSSDTEPGECAEDDAKESSPMDSKGTHELEIENNSSDVEAGECLDGNVNERALNVTQKSRQDSKTDIEPGKYSENVRVPSHVMRDGQDRKSSNTDSKELREKEITSESSDAEPGESSGHDGAGKSLKQIRRDHIEATLPQMDVKPGRCDAKDVEEMSQSDQPNDELASMNSKASGHKSNADNLLFDVEHSECSQQSVAGKSSKLISQVLQTGPKKTQDAKNSLDVKPNERFQLRNDEKALQTVQKNDQNPKSLDMRLTGSLDMEVDDSSDLEHGECAEHEVKDNSEKVTPIVLHDSKSFRLMSLGDDTESDDTDSDAEDQEVSAKTIEEVSKVGQDKENMLRGKLGEEKVNYDTASDSESDIWSTEDVLKSAELVSSHGQSPQLELTKRRIEVDNDGIASDVQPVETSEQDGQATPGERDNTKVDGSSPNHSVPGLDSLSQEEYGESTGLILPNKTEAKPRSLKKSIDLSLGSCNTENIRSFAQVRKPEQSTLSATSAQSNRLPTSGDSSVLKQGENRENEITVLARPSASIEEETNSTDRAAERTAEDVPYTKSSQKKLSQVTLVPKHKSPVPATETKEDDSRITLQSSDHDTRESEKLSTETDVTTGSRVVKASNVQNAAKRKQNEILEEMPKAGSKLESKAGKTAPVDRLDDEDFVDPIVFDVANATDEDHSWKKRRVTGSPEAHECKNVRGLASNDGSSKNKPQTASGTKISRSSVSVSGASAKASSAGAPIVSTKQKNARVANPGVNDAVIFDISEASDNVRFRRKRRRMIALRDEKAENGTGQDHIAIERSPETVVTSGTVVAVDDMVEKRVDESLPIRKTTEGERPASVPSAQHRDRPQQASRNLKARAKSLTTVSSAPEDATSKRSAKATQPPTRTKSSTRSVTSLSALKSHSNVGGSTNRRACAKTAAPARTTSSRGPAAAFARRSGSVDISKKSVRASSSSDEMIWESSTVSATARLTASVTGIAALTGNKTKANRRTATSESDKTIWESKASGSMPSANARARATEEFVKATHASKKATDSSISRRSFPGPVDTFSTVTSSGESPNELFTGSETATSDRNTTKASVASRAKGRSVSSVGVSNNVRAPENMSVTGKEKSPSRSDDASVVGEQAALKSALPSKSAVGPTSKTNVPRKKKVSMVSDLTCVSGASTSSSLPTLVKSSVEESSAGKMAPKTLKASVRADEGETEKTIISKKKKKFLASSVVPASGSATTHPSSTSEKKKISEGAPEKKNVVLLATVEARLSHSSDNLKTREGLKSKAKSQSGMKACPAANSARDGSVVAKSLCAHEVRKPGDAVMDSTSIEPEALSSPTTVDYMMNSGTETRTTKTFSTEHPGNESVVPTPNYSDAEPPHTLEKPSASNRGTTASVSTAAPPTGSVSARSTPTPSGSQTDLSSEKNTHVSHRGTIPSVSDAALPTASATETASVSEKKSQVEPPDSLSLNEKGTVDSLADTGSHAPLETSRSASTPIGLSQATTNSSRPLQSSSSVYCFGTSTESSIAKGKPTAGSLDTENSHNSEGSDNQQSSSPKSVETSDRKMSAENLDKPSKIHSDAISAVVARPDEEYRDTNAETDVEVITGLAPVDNSLAVADSNPGCTASITTCAEPSDFPADSDSHRGGITSTITSSQPLESSFTGSDPNPWDAAANTTSAEPLDSSSSCSDPNPEGATPNTTSAEPLDSSSSDSDPNPEGATPNTISAEPLDSSSSVSDPNPAGATPKTTSAEPLDSSSSVSDPNPDNTAANSNPSGNSDHEADPARPSPPGIAAFRSVPKPTRNRKRSAAFSAVVSRAIQSLVATGGRRAIESPGTNPNQVSSESADGNVLTNVTSRTSSLTECTIGSPSADPENFEIPDSASNTHVNVDTQTDAVSEAFGVERSESRVEGSKAGQFLVQNAIEHAVDEAAPNDDSGDVGFGNEQADMNADASDISHIFSLPSGAPHRRTVPSTSRSFTAALAALPVWTTGGTRVLTSSTGNSAAATPTTVVFDRRVFHSLRASAGTSDVSQKRRWVTASPEVQERDARNEMRSDEWKNGRSANRVAGSAQVLMDDRLSAGERKRRKMMGRSRDCHGHAVNGKRSEESPTNRELNLDVSNADIDQIFAQEANVLASGAATVSSTVSPAVTDEAVNVAGTAVLNQESLPLAEAEVVDIMDFDAANSIDPPNPEIDSQAGPKNFFIEGSPLTLGQCILDGDLPDPWICNLSSGDDNLSTAPEHRQSQNSRWPKIVRVRSGSPLSFLASPADVQNAAPTTGDAAC